MEREKKHNKLIRNGETKTVQPHREVWYGMQLKTRE
jgi:hypothetical protein